MQHKPTLPKMCWVRFEITVTCSVFTVHKKFPALKETQWFNYGKQRLLIYSYQYFSECKYQISVSLNYIVLECLL